jgi:hypothetical protein
MVRYTKLIKGICYNTPGMKKQRRENFIFGPIKLNFPSLTFFF